MTMLPRLLSVPLLAVFGNGADWPTLGAVLAWALVAALVGSGIGALRRHAGEFPSHARCEPVPRVHTFIRARLHHDNIHRQAA
jgi:hypothetical protein